MLKIIVGNPLGSEMKLRKLGGTSVPSSAIRVSSCKPVGYDKRVQYTSKSQIARVISEAWVAEHGYCLACESNRLIQTVANTQARDFQCEACQHPYELKSTVRTFGRSIVDGAFASMMRRIQSGTAPSLLLMRYSACSEVVDLSAIHRSFITPEIVVERTPLAANARRAGWVGCKILLSGIPPEGRVIMLRDGVFTSRTEGRLLFEASEKLMREGATTRSWVRAVLLCLHQLPITGFNLEQVYGFESELAKMFPSNRHVRDKIRQQLQVLRDTKLLVFEGRGRYRLVSSYNERR